MSLDKFTQVVEDYHAQGLKFSDIHICEQSPIKLRIDNDLIAMSEIFGKNDIKSILSESNRNVDKQDDDFSLEAGGFRWRVNSASSFTGKSLVARKIPPTIPEIKSLGLPTFLMEVAQRTTGLFLFTGITGSGKTTSIASLTNFINQQSRVKIETLEDPIEYVYQPNLAEIIQREIPTHTPSFEHGIRAMMRRDPDIAVLGEIRDLETANAAFELAETGHLVFATLHADNAQGSIDRLVSLLKSDSSASMRLSTLSAVLIGTLSQKLIPKIGGGRVLASELMINVKSFKDVIASGDSKRIQQLLGQASSDGMYTLNNDLERLTRSGIITADTAKAFSYDVGTLKV